MRTGSTKTEMHRYSIDMPEDIYVALRIKSAIEKKSVKEIVLLSLQRTLGNDLLKLRHDAEHKSAIEKAFTGASNNTFAEEWRSEEDDKSFENLQKFLNE